jgi:hypothetical protein
MDRQSYLHFEGSGSYAPDTVRSSGACAGSLVLALSCCPGSSVAVSRPCIAEGTEKAEVERAERRRGGESGDGQRWSYISCYGSLPKDLFIRSN